MKNNIFIKYIIPVLEKLPVNYSFVKPQELDSGDFVNKSSDFKRFQDLSSFGIDEYVAPSFYKEISKTLDLNEE